MSKNKKYRLLSLLCALIISLTFIIYGAGKLLQAQITKQWVIQKLNATTGYEVNIEGDLHWHYLPLLHLDVDKISLKDSENLVIIIEKPTINVSLISLLRKQVAANIHFQGWQQNKLYFSDGNLRLSVNNNVITLSDFTASFYQGKIHANASVELIKPSPVFKINLTATSVAIGPLLQSLTNKNSITGKMDLTAKLQSQASNGADFVKHLDGNIDALITEGQLTTLHLGELIADVSSAPSSKTTDIFDSLSMHNSLRQGIASTQLHLKAKSYKAEGNGKIDLITQELKLNIQAYYTQSKQTQNIAIPISISGPLASPDVHIDIVTPLHQWLEAHESKANTQLKKFFRSL